MISKSHSDFTSFAEGYHDNMMSRFPQALEIMENLENH